MSNVDLPSVISLVMSIALATERTLESIWAMMHACFGSDEEFKHCSQKKLKNIKEFASSFFLGPAIGAGLAYLAGHQYPYQYGILGGFLAPYSHQLIRMTAVYKDKLEKINKDLSGAMAGIPTADHGARMSTIEKKMGDLEKVLDAVNAGSKDPRSEAESGEGEKEPIKTGGVKTRAVAPDVTATLATNSKKVRKTKSNKKDKDAPDNDDA